MVTPESYIFAKGRLPKGINGQAVTVNTVALDRALSGTWSVTANLEFRFKLADGREVVVNKKLRLRGAQEGKRPHPNPFGRKKRKK